MKKLLIPCLFLLLISTTFAQEIKTAQLSPEKLKLRAELESDRTILQASCGKFRYAENVEEIQKENSRIRLLLFQASQASDKTVKARKTCSSVEGTPMVGYLVVENGKINYVADYSRDEFGGFKFNKYDCSKLSIGTYELNDKKSEMIFTPLEDKDLDGKNLFLQCKTENREFVF